MTYVNLGREDKNPRYIDLHLPIIDTPMDMPKNFDFVHTEAFMAIFFSGHSK